MTTQKDFPFKVGDKITNHNFGYNKWWEIVGIDKDQNLFFFYDYSFRGELNLLSLTCYDWKEWYIRIPKKTIRMAPALRKTNGSIAYDGYYYPTTQLFLSEKEAKAIKDGSTVFIQWPLTINGVEQWVDVPVEEM